MSCYKCKFRGNVIGSAHSCCNVIKSTNDEKSGALELLLASGQLQLTNDVDDPIVKLDPWGIKNGWAMWPLNFDPVWVNECGFFTEKEVVNETVE